MENNIESIGTQGATLDEHVDDRTVDPANDDKDHGLQGLPADIDDHTENHIEPINEFKSEKMDTIIFQTAINDFMGFDDDGGNPNPAHEPILPIDANNANGIPIVRPSTVMPADIRQLTIRNLDTGEEFIIGENDPDFDFDTFELCAGPHHERNNAEPVKDNGHDAINVQTTQPEATPNQSPRATFWQLFMTFIYSIASSPRRTGKSSFNDVDGHDGGLAQAKERSNSVCTDDSSTTKRPKMPFTKLSSFKFRKELGRGAFGRVLLAEAKTDGKLYALKIISKKNMKSSDKRQAKTERDILLAMGHISPHPFTAGLRFAFQSENNLYLGMDYLPGGNLKELIKRFGSLPEEWARLFSAELTLAIAHLHSLNVIYRDIKPHNVMIDAHGHVILIDFGLSKQDISHPRGALSLVGTPDYSAPEVLKTGVYQIEQSNRLKGKDNHGKDRNRRKPPKPSAHSPNQEAVTDAGSKMEIPPHIGYGRAADWWSLGIMIYEMISGTPTFRGADIRQTYQKVLYSEVEFKPDEKFSVSAKLLLLGLLKKEPSDRLGSWSNPPQDIMSHSFFHDINWDTILQRKRDGPWVPEPIAFGRKPSPQVAKAAVVTLEQQQTLNDEDQAPIAVTENAVADSTASHKSARPKSVDLTKSEAPTADCKDVEDDRNSFAGRPTEMMQLRDSIIAFSRTQQANRIQDWSFFDESILVSASDQQNAASAEANLADHKTAEDIDRIPS